jgi:hypothetical protein
MIDDKYIELMNLEIDGALSDEDRHKLERYLESHADALEHYNALRNTTDILNGTEEIEPPAALSRDIIESIFERHSEAKGRCLSTGGVTWRTFRWRPGFAFAAGIIAGLFLFASALLFIMKSPAGEGNFYGTIAGLKDATAQRTAVIDGPGVQGLVRTRRSGETIVAELEIWSPDEILVQFIHGDDIYFEGVRTERPGTPRISVFADRIELALTGKGEYIIGLNDRSGSRSPIDLRITSNGVVLFEKRIFQESER